MLDAPHNGTATSIAAAESITGSAAGDRATILKALKSAGVCGLTRDELATFTEISPNTIRPRCVELLDAGLIRKSDEVRRSASGRKCEVLVLA